MRQVDIDRSVSIMMRSCVQRRVNKRYLQQQQQQQLAEMRLMQTGCADTASRPCSQLATCLPAVTYLGTPR